MSDVVTRFNRLGSVRTQEKIGGARNANDRVRIVPLALRPQGTPRALQAKMQSGRPAGPSRVIGGPSGGVVQANVIGGNHALQARLNLWNTRLTRGASTTVVQNQSSNLAQAAVAPGASRA